MVPYPSATYLVTGGLGGLGKAISVRLVEKGARNLLFLSPSAGSKPAHHQLFTELEGMSCNLIAIQGAVQSETDVRNAIAAARSPIKGLLPTLCLRLRALADQMALGAPAASTCPIHRHLS